MTKSSFGNYQKPPPLRRTSAPPSIRPIDRLRRLTFWFQIRKWVVLGALMMLIGFALLVVAMSEYSDHDNAFEKPVNAVVGETNTQIEQPTTVDEAVERTTSSSKSEDALSRSGSDGVIASNESGENPEEDIVPPEIKVFSPVQKNLPASKLPRSIKSAGGKNPFDDHGSPSKSTVFVIDKSGSMSQDNRFARVMVSVKQAIQRLNSKQKFNVILFDSDAQSFSSNESLLPATIQNKSKASEFCETVVVGNGTYPLPALRVALDGNPERIVVLSDGEFDPTIVEIITQENHGKHRPIRIDCVGLDETVSVLQELARENKGTYFQAL